MVDNVSYVVLQGEFNDENALREIETFSHLWLLWKSKEKSYHITVRPPRLGGNRRVGVFASRSPFRPNGICLSCVKLEGIEKFKGKLAIKVSGADILSGTEIIDIKPYIPYSDCVENAVGGFADEFSQYRLRVADNGMLDGVEHRDEIIKILACDPRPAYQDSDRVYTLDYDGNSVSFTVEKDVLTVTKIEKI